MKTEPTGTSSVQTAAQAVPETAKAQPKKTGNLNGRILVWGLAIGAVAAAACYEFFKLKGQWEPEIPQDLKGLEMALHKCKNKEEESFCKTLIDQSIPLLQKHGGYKEIGYFANHCVRKLNPTCQTFVKEAFPILVNNELGLAKHLANECMEKADPACVFINQNALPLMLATNAELKDLKRSGFKDKKLLGSYVNECIEKQNKECMSAVVREARNLVSQGIIDSSLAYAGKTDQASQAILKEGFNWLCELAEDNKDWYEATDWADYCRGKQDPACQSIIKQFFSTPVDKHWFIYKCIRDKDQQCVELARKIVPRVVEIEEDQYARDTKKGK
jgi:hypothetical protein